MEFRILGPLEVWDGEARSPWAGRGSVPFSPCSSSTERGRPRDRLIDELWGEDSPETPPLPPGLRLGAAEGAAAGVLATRSPGYLIRIEAASSTSDRFERLVEEGRSLLAEGLAAERRERLREALSCGEARRSRTSATRRSPRARSPGWRSSGWQRWSCGSRPTSRCGRHAELVGELEALVAEHPLRERLRAQLMTALYRCGRQAEALEAYREARRALVEELGIDPSPALQELERAILGHDPSLAVEAAPHGRPGGRRAVDPRAIAHEAQHRPAARGGRAAREATAARAHPRPARAGRGRARGRVGLARGAPVGASARGIAARAASFTSTAPGGTWPGSPPSSTSSSCSPRLPTSCWPKERPTSSSSRSSRETPCDVALLVPRERPPAGPVLVPFGGAEHDWAAVELGAWLARADAVPLRLAGAAAVPEHGRRDASRLLSHGALAVQRVLGIAAEPLLTRPGEEGMLEASRDAGLLVVGLSTRWHQEGLGPARLGLARMPRRRRCSSARPAPRRPRSAGDAHSLHVVDPLLSRTRS